MMDLDAETAPLLSSLDLLQDRIIRRGFMGRVFALLTMQLSVVTAGVLVTWLVDIIHDFMTAEDSFYLIRGAFFASLATYIITVALFYLIPALRDRLSTMMTLLATVTVASTVMLSIACTVYGITGVIAALGITASCCLGISIFSFKTKYDLDSWHGVAFCVLLGVMCTSLSIPIPFSTAPIKLVTGFVAILAILVMVFDLRRITSQSPENALSPEHYLGAVFELFLLTIVLLALIFVIALVTLAKLKTSRFRRHSDEDE